MKRMLVVRGGALGDLILTLPAVAALQMANPDAQIEVLGNSGYQSLLRECAKVAATHVLDAAALAPFFSQAATLPDRLAKWFASFDLVISYLHDPDRIFETNIRATGVTNFIQGPWSISDGAHAARQLLEPLAPLGIDVTRLVPAFFLQSASVRPNPDVIALHPGSGSVAKNWSIDKWIELGDRLLGQGATLLVLTGESDQRQREILTARWNRAGVQFANCLSLPEIAVRLPGRMFLGHDSGVSHLAAAAGAHCILLYGPTHPDVWAPPNENVRIVRAPGNDLASLAVGAVMAAIDQELMRIGIST